MQEEGTHQVNRTMSLLKAVVETVLPLSVVMLGAVLALYLLGRLPGVIYKPPLQEYRSVEEAEAALGVDIFLPAYSPEYLTWTSLAVKVKQQPMLIISLSLPFRQEEEEGLIIRQVISPEPSPAGISPLRKVETQTSVTVKGKEAKLLFGTGEGGKWYNEVRWREGDRYLILTMTAIQPPRELLKIAGSMRP